MPAIDVVSDANIALQWFHEVGEEDVAPARELLDRHRRRELVIYQPLYRDLFRNLRHHGWRTHRTAEALTVGAPSSISSSSDRWSATFTSPTHRPSPPM